MGEHASSAFSRWLFGCYLHRAEATAFGRLRGGHRIWMSGTVALKQQRTELGGTFTNEAVFGDHKHPSKAAAPANATSVYYYLHCPLLPVQAAVGLLSRLPWPVVVSVVAVPNALPFTSLVSGPTTQIEFGPSLT